MFYLYRGYHRCGRRFAVGRVWIRVATLLLPAGATLVPLLFVYLADRVLAVRITPIEVIHFGGYAVAIFAAIFAGANRLADLLITLRQRKSAGLDALTQIITKLIAVLITVVLLIAGGPVGKTTPRNQKMFDQQTIASDFGFLQNLTLGNG